MLMIREPPRPSDFGGRLSVFAPTRSPPTVFGAEFC
jgi:hypothetical protein